MISAIILNDHNRDIKKTLVSLKWCDEIIVWTKPINGNFAKARNEAMITAKNEWVLFLDSDETLKDDTLQTLQGVILKDEHDGFYLKRRDFFWNHEIKFGEAGSSRLLRFGKKSAGIWKRKVHEYWDIKNTAILDNLILHYPHSTVSEFLNSINRYTDIDVFEQKKFSYFRLFFYPPGKFIYNYVFKLGFLDGYPGLVYAFMMSFHSLLVRVKMWEKHGL